MIRFLIGGCVGIALATDKPETGAAALLSLAVLFLLCMLTRVICWLNRSTPPAGPNLRWIGTVDMTVTPARKPVPKP